MTTQLKEIAIVGAGLGGTALALALSSSLSGCSITVFEARSQDELASISSGVTLTPNGLHILERLQVLPQIRDKCYIATYRCFKDRNDKTTKKIPIALQEKYGFSNHRIWRKVLLDTMLDMLGNATNVKIFYRHKLTQLRSASNAGLMFDVLSKSLSGDNVATHRADLLIGSDGINSTVRRLLFPSVQAQYTGTSGLLTHVPRASISWPYQDYERNATIQDVPGALFFLCEDPQEKHIMIGKQITHLDASVIQDRAALEALQADKNTLCSYFCAHYDEYGSTARKILDAVTQHKKEIFIWPFMRMPELPSWFREADGRVLILGDAAHAIPPSSGQGVNQVLEDAWMLTLLLRNDIGSQGQKQNAVPEMSQSELLSRLKFWQTSRQERINRIYEWATNVQNVGRLSQAEREAVEKAKAEQGGDATASVSTGPDDMAWLYTPWAEGAVEEWLQSREESI